MLQFALTAIQDEVRERRRKWTWEYFAERRDDRRKYVELFKKKQLNQLTSVGQNLVLFSFLIACSIRRNYQLSKRLRRSCPMRTLDFIVQLLVLSFERTLKPKGSSKKKGGRSRQRIGAVGPAGSGVLRPALSPRQKRMPSRAK